MMTDCTNSKNYIQASHGSSTCGICTNSKLTPIINHNSQQNNCFNLYNYLQKDLSNGNIRCQDLVNDYQGLVNDYQGLINDYQGLVNDYKGLVNDYKGLVNDYKGYVNDCKGFVNDCKHHYNELLDCFNEKLEKQLKDLTKCLTKKDTFLSNYETITVVGK